MTTHEKPDPEKFGSGYPEQSASGLGLGLGLGLRAEAGGAGEGRASEWTVVDLLRVMKLPEGLRRLWPAEMMPRTVPKSSVGKTGVSDSFVPPIPKRRGSLDILSAWLKGFAGELTDARARLSIVISSGAETLHLEVFIRDGLAWTILAMLGEGFDEFSGYQFLRRTKTTELAGITEDLAALITADCALTLTYMTDREATDPKSSGIEFLLKTDQGWSRPCLERDGEGLKVGGLVGEGENAVRALLASTLSRIYRASAPGLP